MIKLLLWLNYGEIMKVGEGRNFGIPQESRLHIWVFCGLPGCCFFQWMALLIMTLSFKCYRSHWKVKKVFLNVQNIRTDNLNLVKLLRNTCKWDFFLFKNERSQRFFFKILLTIFQRYCLLLTTLILRDTSHSFSVNLVASYTIVQLCRFKTNKTLIKYFKYLMKLKKL